MYSSIFPGDNIMIVERGSRNVDPDGHGGFEVQGDKTKFATLQKQRKQIYDEIRDSKYRAQVRT